MPGIRLCLTVTLSLALSVGAFEPPTNILTARLVTHQTTHRYLYSLHMMASNKGGLFLFDFDGVVCDSCDECTVSALRTCRKLQVLPEGAPEYPPQWLLDKMREIRPAIEVGWQIPVLLSVFLNNPEMPVPEILANYERLVEEWLQKWGKTDQVMIQAFGDTRDSWIAEDMPSWLDINKFYPGVPEALSNCQGQAVLVTTKQQRFATALCRHAGVGTEALPDDDIYGLGMYKKKSDVIVDRMKTGGYSPAEVWFFEDRWPTLSKCLKDERLEGVKLHLASWGYVTEEELELARAEPRVKVINLDDFAIIVSS